jgi:HEAT repeat protein
MPFVTVGEAALAASDQPDCARLDAPDGTERRRAARGTPADSAGIAALGARLRHEADPSVRDAILNRLTEIGTEAAARQLAACLGAQDAALRNGAIAALRLMPEPTLAVLPEVLADPDHDVRLFGVNILQGLSHPDTPDRLAELLSAAADVNIAAAVVEALAEVGQSGQLPAVRAARIRFAAHPSVVFACDLAAERMLADAAGAP